jgi:predicted RNase H-like HicB family nuclease
MAKIYKVTAIWDDEAKYWVAESDDVPGLATGAATVEELFAKLKVMVPELLELNDGMQVSFISLLHCSPFHASTGGRNESAMPVGNKSGLNSRNVPTVSVKFRFST